MTTQEIYEILGRPRLITGRIQRLTMQRDELESAALPGAIRYDRDTVQTSPEDRMADVLAKVADIDAEIEQLRREKAKAVMRVSEMIEALEDEGQRQLMSALYIARMSMTEAAAYVNYSRRQAYRIRREAIERWHTMAH
jgi:predicted transcriptional regulator